MKALLKIARANIVCSEGRHNVKVRRRDKSPNSRRESWGTVVASEITSKGTTSVAPDREL